MLWVRYKLTLERYQEMLDAQEGRCAICGTDSPGADKENFQVDHDHGCCAGRNSCGLCVRALLCVRCNRVLLPTLESELATLGYKYLDDWQFRLAEMQ